MLLLPPSSTLFPYTTLFRSLVSGRQPSRVLLNPGWPADRPLPEVHHRVGLRGAPGYGQIGRDTSELQSPMYLVCRLLLEKKKTKINKDINIAETYIISVKYT